MNRLLVLALLAGCNPTLSAQTLAPPGRVATLQPDDGHYDLEITQGVALAIACDHGGACKDLVVSTQDASVADVKGASITANALGGEVNPRPYVTTATTSQFLVIGKRPGKTTIKVKTSDGGRTIDVHVVPPPASGAPAVVAN